MTSIVHSTKTTGIPSVALLTCMWKRHKLTDLIFNNYAIIKDRLHGKLNLHLIAVGSEGDVSRDLAEKHGFTYIESPNSPLGAKWNSGMPAVLESGADAMVVVGSDDLLNLELFHIYADRLVQGYVFVGLADTYFWDLSNRQLALWRGYAPPRQGEPMGLGRLIHRDLLAAMAWKPWDDELEKSLDFSMMVKLAPLLSERDLLDRITVLSCRQDNIAPVDVKGGENMWGFEHVLMSCMAFDLVDDLAVLGQHYEPEILEGFLRLSGARRAPLPARRSFAPAQPVTIEVSASNKESLQGLSTLVLAADMVHELEGPAAMRAVGLTALNVAAGGKAALVSLHSDATTGISMQPRVQNADFHIAPDSTALAACIKTYSPDVILATGQFSMAQTNMLLETVRAENCVRPLRIVRDSPYLVNTPGGAGNDPMAQYCDAILTQHHEGDAPSRKDAIPSIFRAPTFYIGPPCDAPRDIRRNICFAGNVLNAALQSRMRLFIRHGLPIIRQAIPGTLFTICSFQPTAYLQGLAGEGVLLVGDMRDMTRTMSLYAMFLSFETAFTGVCHGFQGLALACGMPVVTGNKINAFHNGNERNSFTQNSPVEIAQTCIRLLTDNLLWRHTSNQARSIVNNSLNIDITIDALASLKAQWSL